MEKYSAIILCASLMATPVMASKDAAPADYKSNFYQAVNAQWLEANTISEDKSSISTFSDINDAFVKDASALMQKLINKSQRSADEQKLVDFYTSFIDMENRNAKGIAPIQSRLDRIDEVQDYAQLVRLMADMSYEGAEIPYAVGLTTDSDDANAYVINTMQSGTTLQKKYYGSDSDEAQTRRKNYTDYMSEMLTLAGFNDVETYIENNMLIETALAKNSLDLAQLYDVKQTHNPADFETLNALLSNFDMAYYFERIAYPTDMKVNISTPDYFRALNELLTEMPLKAWKDYLKTQLVIRYGDSLSQDFVDAGLRYQVKEGLATELEPLEIRGIRNTSAALAFLFGKIYIETYFNEEIKNKVQQILEVVLNEYRVAISATTRLSPPTREAALKKLDKMAFNIAYPDEWRDYSLVQSKADDLVYNITQLVSQGHAWDAEKLKRGTVDKNEWGYPSQDVNAYYSANANKFVILAGILKSPIFDIENNDAANYGGIGLVIGHEIGHAFDARGAQYDEMGNLNNWWTEADLAKNEELKKALIEQANQYELAPGVFANGKLQVGEIQADLSGAEIALRAYLGTLEDDKAVREQGIRDFYIQFARTWKLKARPGALIIMNDSDPHPIAEYRINGTVKNMQAFYDAFDVKEGDPMYLAEEDRVSVWNE